MQRQRLRLRDIERKVKKDEGLRAAHDRAWMKGQKIKPRETSKHVQRLFTQERFEHNEILITVFLYLSPSRSYLCYFSSCLPLYSSIFHLAMIFLLLLFTPLDVFFFGKIIMRKIVNIFRGNLSTVSKVVKMGC